MDLETIRRILSVIFITIDVILVGVFFVYAYYHYEKHAWRENLPVHASLALGTYFFGRLITQIWSWIVLMIPAGSMSFEVPGGLTFGVALFASFITIVGAAWTVYVFTPAGWRLLGWMMAVIITALFVGLTWNL